jgi:hypothetical protein
MTYFRAFSVLIVCSLLIPTVAPAGDKPSGKKSTVKDVKAMPEKDQTALALRAAPARISKDAGVMIYGQDGKLMEVKKSTNGFTCIPTVTNLPIPDPVCMDQASTQWMMDVMNNAPKPSNTVPGVAYMAAGGSHYEKDGKVVMAGEGAKIVKEPPHWMVMWPFDPAASQLPTVPNSSGVYIMFEGSPAAQLMFYQDPNKMK